MPAQWSIGKRGGTNDWMVYRDGTPHGRPHPNSTQAESARKNFEWSEMQAEITAAKKRRDAQQKK